MSQISPLEKFKDFMSTFDGFTPQRLAEISYGAFTPHNVPTHKEVRNLAGVLLAAWSEIEKQREEIESLRAALRVADAQRP